MKKKVALAFDEKDLLEIEMIVHDQDKDAALAFVHEMKRRAEAAQRSICGQGVVAGSQSA